MTSPDAIRLLLVEDYLPTVDGLRATLEHESSSERSPIAVLERAPSTSEDAVAFFAGAARHGPDALRGIRVDAVLVDAMLPRESGDPPDFAAVEIAIRVTAIYDAAGIEETARPRLILSTASPNPCDVRAFVAYGGTAVINKVAVSPHELRRRVRAIVGGEDRWTPPTPDVPHTYQPSFARYLRGYEEGGGNQIIARRIGGPAESVARVKNQLRHAFDLPQRATDLEIVAAAQKRGITWIPLRHEDKAKEHGVRPRLALWDAPSLRQGSREGRDNR